MPSKIVSPPGSPPSNGVPADAVVAMLRQFHDRMTAEIFACGGTVEKYIRDAIFAVFGLPNAGKIRAEPRGAASRSRRLRRGI